MAYIPPTMMEQLPRTAKGFVGGLKPYEEFRQLLYDLVEEQQPMTVRQVFYRCVVKGYVEKTESGYSLIQQDLVKMRRSGQMPYDWIIDESRSVRGTQGTNESVQEFMGRILDDIPTQYSRDLLADHNFSIQVWLEKEALLGVVHPITLRWGVPLCPAKGYASLSFLHEAAQDLEYKNRPAKIFHFGDYDPSGQNAIQTVQRDLPELAPITAKLGIEFQIVAVTPQQIQALNLPTRPTKKTDKRAQAFGSEVSVELDAIEPDVLRQMVDETLAACFPPGAREANRARQKAEREEIRRWLSTLRR